MNYKKIILASMTLLSLQKIMSQNSFINSNIQSHLADKFWSSKENTNEKIMFHFKSNGEFRLYTAGNEVGFENYYISQDDCVNRGTAFDESKVGTISSGNYINTKGFCYVIEFYPDLKKFRIRPTNSNKWQDFYLLE